MWYSMPVQAGPPAVARPDNVGLGIGEMAGGRIGRKVDTWGRITVYRLWRTPCINLGTTWPRTSDPEANPGILNQEKNSHSIPLRNDGGSALWIGAPRAFADLADRSGLSVEASKKLKGCWPCFDREAFPGSDGTKKAHSDWKWAWEIRYDFALGAHSTHERITRIKPENTPHGTCWFV